MKSKFIDLFKSLLEILEKEPYKTHENTTKSMVTSFHEAGHTIYAYNNELGFKRTALDRDNENYGLTEIDEKLKPEKRFDYVKYFSDGIISAYLFTGDFNPDAFSGDYCQIRNCKVCGGLSEEKLKCLFKETIEYVKKAEVEGEIKYIAEKLCSLGQINSDCMERLMKEYRGKSNVS